MFTSFRGTIVESEVLRDVDPLLTAAAAPDAVAVAGGAEGEGEGDAHLQHAIVAVMYA